MQQKKIAGIFFGLAFFICISPLTSFAEVNNSPIIGQTNNTNLPANKVIARIWHGRTLTTKADEYYTYLNEAGIKKILAIPGNLGAQVLRRTDGKITEFTVISYWESRDAIRKFAGNNIEKARYLPRDKEYLLELEPNVKHFEVLLDDRKFK
ncbi:antibiotic biosynthesis monooxygenase [Chlorogloeopsis sp. ULAP01]|uniref:antibiotic biosynthesis monooxygenase family protein n=1 Tax=Chlorogloeopsis sp. ULAP01 TaxID=3056483 RepID=UPI0025AB1130|nr:antibiotic biosynthesis monooxygenase [Chlorogloeopsis sp. ULAP01]MDM9385383.1 antibiotic biosynthesis monooxygenase [Chlorogloeopsis sp. ULAP01]